MRVAALGPTSTMPTPTSGRGDAAGFAQLLASPPQAPTAARMLGPPTPIGALLAVQQVLPRATAQTAAVRRAGRLLELLGQVQLTLIEGDGDEAAWRDLARALGEERPATGLPGLETLLDAIELRAAVEMTKHELAERR